LKIFQTLIKKKKNINKNECKEVTDNIDFNVYSHIRIYDLDHKHYITLYPHYLTEHKHKCTGSFGLFIKKKSKESSFVTKEPFKILNLENNLIPFYSNKEEKIIHSSLGIFNIVDNMIRQKINSRTLYLVYDFENKKLETIEQVTKEQVTNSSNNTVKFSILKKVDNKEENIDMTNNYVFFEWSATGNTRLNIYDNLDNNGKQLSGVFYKINKDRDTFYLTNVSNPNTEINNTAGDKNFIQVGKNSYFYEHDASIFAYKKIFSPVTKSINTDVSIKLINRFKYHGNSDKKVFIENMNINTLTKVKIAMDNDKATDMSLEEKKYIAVISSMRIDKKKKGNAGEISKNMYQELLELVAETIKIKDSQKYYLVEVNQDSDKKTYKKLKYISFENNSILSNIDVTHHLKVWVRESV